MRKRRNSVKLNENGGSDDNLHADVDRTSEASNSGDTGRVEEGADMNVEMACQALYGFVIEHITYELRMLLIQQGYKPSGQDAELFSVSPYKECTFYQNERFGVFLFLGQNILLSAGANAGDDDMSVAAVADTLRSVLHQSIGPVGDVYRGGGRPSQAYQVKIHDVGPQPYLEILLDWRRIYESLEIDPSASSAHPDFLPAQKNGSVHQDRQSDTENDRNYASDIISRQQVVDQARAQLLHRMKRAQNYKRRSCRQCAAVVALNVLALFMVFLFVHAYLLPYGYQQWIRGSSLEHGGGLPVAAFEAIPESWRSMNFDQLTPSCTLLRALSYASFSQSDALDSFYAYHCTNSNQYEPHGNNQESEGFE